MVIRFAWNGVKAPRGSHCEAQLVRDKSETCRITAEADLLYLKSCAIFDYQTSPVRGVMFLICIVLKF